MSIFDYKNDDTTSKSEGRHIGRNGKGTDLARELCERIGKIIGVSSIWQKGKGIVMERVLKLFGYREKTANVYETIKIACLLNIEAKERLDAVRATLNGENSWFKGDDKNGLTSE